MKTKKRISFLLLFIAGFLTGQSALAQEVNASGVVKDANGEALIGVVISAEGTSIGAVTGLDGDFSLLVPQGTTLSFSQLGFQTQKARAAANMNITLQEDNATTLQAVEVVGVGYGTMRRGDLTGAISSVNAGNMKQGIITSAEQLLQGKIAGLSVVQGSGDPTSGAVVRLRGGSSLSGENAPLYVVDGIASVDINTIPAADIISIDVLKDASAAAIYGSRGANGVIIVTTKRKDIDSRSATYTGYFGVAKAANKLKLLDANSWNEHRDINFNEGGNTDWQDEIMQTALTQSHSLTFSNISQQSGLKGTISYLNSEGVVQTSQLERLSGAISGFTSLLNDLVTIDLGLSKTQDNYKHLNGADEDMNMKRIFISAYQANPTWPVYAADGSLYKVPQPATALWNPRNFLDKFSDDRTRDRFMGYAKADIWVLKEAKNEGLKGTINLSTNSTQTQQKRYFSIYEQRQIAFNKEGMRGRADRVSESYKQQQLEMYLNYDKTFDSVHKLNLMGGYSFTKEDSESFGVGTRDYDYDDFMYNNLGASKNLDIYSEEDFYKFFSSGADYAYSNKDDSKLASFFGRVNYTYKTRYMFTATLRADGSSKFGENHKWGYFPSASLAWRITDELFMQGTKKWLDDLKLRVGYGVTGNQGGIKSYTSIYTFKPKDGHTLSVDESDDPNFIPTLKYEVSRNDNPDLKWESTGQFNAGLDFSVLKNRLSGTFEVYYKKTTDLLYYNRVQSMREDYTLMNIGELRNAGVELSLNGIIMKTKDFSWTANLNLAHNSNKFLGFNIDVEKLQMGIIQTADRNIYENMPSGQYTQKLKPGYSVGSFFGAKTGGLDENGKIIYLHKDGSQTTDYNSLTAEEKDEYLGCAMPKLTMGFGMNFTYKNFDLGVSTIGIFGQKVYNVTKMILSTPYLEGNEGYNQLTSSLGTTGLDRNISDYWLENASFFRIQNITLGYTFDLKDITKNTVKSLRIYATVENPFVFTSYSGVDPEVSLDMNVTEKEEWKKKSPGLDDFNNYPKPRTFLFGVNAKF